MDDPIDSEDDDDDDDIIGSDDDLEDSDMPELSMGNGSRQHVGAKRSGMYNEDLSTGRKRQKK